MARRLKASVKAKRLANEVEALYLAMMVEHGPNGPSAVAEACDLLNTAIDKLCEASVVLDEYERKPLYQVWESEA